MCLKGNFASMASKNRRNYGGIKGYQVGRTIILLKGNFAEELVSLPEKG